MPFILDETSIHKIISDMDNSDFMDRRKAEYKAMEVYSGGIGHHVGSRLKELFPVSWDKMTISDISLSNKIINKVAQAYKEKPIRKLDNDDNTQLYNKLTKQGDLNKVFEQFDVIMNRHRHGALWVSLNNPLDINKGFLFRALEPYRFATVRNKINGAVEAFIVNFPDREITQISGTGDGIEQVVSEDQSDTSAETKVFGMWTAFQHFIVKVRRAPIRGNVGKKDIQIQIMEIPGNPNNINPLGMLPFYFDTVDPSVDNPLLNPITDQAINFGVQASNLFSAAAIQGFGQLVISAEEGSQPQKVQTGLTTSMFLGQPSRPDAPRSTAEYISPNPDLEGQLKTLSFYAKGVVSEHLGTAPSTIGGDSEGFNSGLDRAIASADVQDKIKSNQDNYAEAENWVFDIVKRYYNVAGSSTFQAEEKLTVLYVKPKILISDGETLKNIKDKMDMGLTDREESLMVLDPNLSPEDAEKRVKEIDQKVKDRATLLFGGASANNQNEDKLPPGPERQAGPVEGPPKN
jgi:hypothetical protein